jgi:hypothetical protein
MAPFGGDTAIIRVLTNDPNELEIVQFGATLTPGQLSEAERIAFHLGHENATAIQEAISLLVLAIAASHHSH